jgi:arsenate reductase (glutaredoxin)
MTIIFHNPRCSKSRQALELLKEKTSEVEVVEYLKTPPTAEELKGIVAKLGIQAQELIRKNEQIFKDHYKGKELSNEEWIAAMVEHPKLIERPIIIKGQKAVIGRPPENVGQLF